MVGDINISDVGDIMVDRSLWRQFYRVADFPPLPCPRCAAGSVLLNRDSLRLDKPAYVTDGYEDDHWNPDEDTGSFICTLVCDTPTCGEVVAVAGATCRRDDAYFLDDVRDFLYPAMMSPPPPLIQLPASLPKDVKVLLVSAFSLFWVDAAACANRLRTCVEKLMAEYGAKTAPLRDKILAFEKQNVEHARTFTAIRLVGNVGSHESKVQRRTLIDVFCLLEDAILDLFCEDRGIDLTELKTKIILAKGQPSFDGGVKALIRLNRFGY